MSIASVYGEVSAEILREDGVTLPLRRFPEVFRVQLDRATGLRHRRRP